MSTHETAVKFPLPVSIKGGNNEFQGLRGGRACTYFARISSCFFFSSSSWIQTRQSVSLSCACIDALEGHTTHLLESLETL